MAGVLSLDVTSARKLIQTSSGGDDGGGGDDREEGRSDGLGVVNGGSARQAAGKAAKSWR